MIVVIRIILGVGHRRGIGGGRAMAHACGGGGIVEKISVVLFKSLQLLVKAYELAVVELDFVHVDNAFQCLCRL